MTLSIPDLVITNSLESGNLGLCKVIAQINPIIPGIGICTPISNSVEETDIGTIKLL